MFMLTWPGVLTNYGDIFAEDKYQLSEQWTSNISLGLAVHNNIVDNQFGFESMRIFYPEMEKSKSRLLKRASATLQYEKEHWSYNVGLAYGERAPSVSEGYGFYLFNSFDRFDYIGNPGMKNEKSASLNGGLSYNRSKFSAKLSGSYFYITDYIIGRPDNSLSVMTIGATGVKVYEQLKYAHILNASFDLNYQLTENLFWSSKLSYRNGTGQKVNNLPLIQPFSYSSDMAYSIKTFSANVSINGAAKQSKYNPDFGEQALPAYLIANLSVSNRFKLGSQSMLVKAGVENLFDRNYATFADWNRLPRMGRNFYLNMIYNF
jgi:iron complex outermembrane receptor protein